MIFLWAQEQHRHTMLKWKRIYRWTLVSGAMKRLFDMLKYKALKLSDTRQHFETRCCVVQLHKRREKRERISLPLGQAAAVACHVPSSVLWAAFMIPWEIYGFRLVKVEMTMMMRRNGMESEGEFNKEAEALSLFCRHLVENRLIFLSLV